jgi:hypothetical protein
VSPCEYPCSVRQTLITILRIKGSWLHNLSLSLSFSLSSSLYSLLSFLSSLPSSLPPYFVSLRLTYLPKEAIFTFAYNCLSLLKSISFWHHFLSIKTISLCHQLSLIFKSSRLLLDFDSSWHTVNIYLTNSQLIV